MSKVISKTSISLILYHLITTVSIYNWTYRSKVQRSVLSTKNLISENKHRLSRHQVVEDEKWHWNEFIQSSAKLDWLL